MSFSQVEQAWVAPGLRTNDKSVPQTTHDHVPCNKGDVHPANAMIKVGNSAADCQGPSLVPLKHLHKPVKMEGCLGM